MRMKEPMLTEKICSAVEKNSADFEKVYKCPKCGRIIYEEELTDKCPDCMMLLSGSEELIFSPKNDFGVIAKIMLATVLTELFMPFALLGICPKLDVRVAIYFSGIYVGTFNYWALWINPIYLSYVQIDEKLFMRRNLAGGKRRCVVYFILQGIVFLFFSQLLRIDRRMTILSLVLLLIAFIISGIVNISTVF